MTKNNFLPLASNYPDLDAPEAGFLAGYGAIIAKFELSIPIPTKLSLISTKNRQYETQTWQVFTPRYTPDNNLGAQLTFALKYEGIELGVFKSLFKKIKPEEIVGIIKNKPQGQYLRRIWFIYEWLMNKKLNLPDLEKRSYIDLLDSKQQYPGPSINSPRHKVRNNLPGTRDFCPLIRRTPLLDELMNQKLSLKNKAALKKIPDHIFQRASAFLLLKDSKSSFDIEGEQSPHQRLRRWGQAIASAGSIDLTPEEILRLQKIIIQDQRLIQLGWRTQGGFVGAHDPSTQAPLPEHISARWEDIESLMSGLIKTWHHLKSSELDPVLVATIISFGFVFIHPLEDGNGRLHRYLIHHVLKKMEFSSPQFIFPISAAILDQIDQYRKVLENYSRPLLKLIEWEPTQGNNIKVTNQTKDYYRYFDATSQAEFLYKCLKETVEAIIPQEIKYLQFYDEFKSKILSQFEMSDKTISLLISFLRQNQGKLLKRAINKEFSTLTQDEVEAIEEMYQETFL